jgi:hypothetical protein
MQVIVHYYTSEIYKPTVIGHRARARQEMQTEFRAGSLFFSIRLEDQGDVKTTLTLILLMWRI